MIDPLPTSRDRKTRVTSTSWIGDGFFDVTVVDHRASPLLPDRAASTQRARRLAAQVDTMGKITTRRVLSSTVDPTCPFTGGVLPLDQQPIVHMVRVGRG